MHYSDEQLMTFLSSRNQTDINQATTSLYQRYFTSILYLVRENQFLRLDDKSFAMDIFLDSVAGLITKAQTMTSFDDFNLGGYFRGIFKNKFLDAAQKEKKRREKLAEETEIGDKKEEAKLQEYDIKKTEKSFIAAFFKVFSALKEDRKHILCWHYYVNKKYEDLADKVIQDPLFSPDLIDAKKRVEIEKHYRITVRDKAWEVADALIHEQVAGLIRQRAVRALSKLKDELRQFDIEELSFATSFTIENLCQQYFNHKGNG